MNCNQNKINIPIGKIGDNECRCSYTKEEMPNTTKDVDIPYLSGANWNDIELLNDGSSNYINVGIADSDYYTIIYNTSAIIKSSEQTYLCLVYVDGNGVQSIIEQSKKIFNPFPLGGYTAFKVSLTIQCENELLEGGNVYLAGVSNSASPVLTIPNIGSEYMHIFRVLQDDNS